MKQKQKTGKTAPTPNKNDSQNEGPRIPKSKQPLTAWIAAPGFALLAMTADHANNWTTLPRPL